MAYKKGENVPTKGSTFPNPEWEMHFFLVKILFFLGTRSIYLVILATQNRRKGY